MFHNYLIFKLYMYFIFVFSINECISEKIFQNQSIPSPKILSSSPQLHLQLNKEKFSPNETSCFYVEESLCNSNSMLLKELSDNYYSLKKHENGNYDKENRNKYVSDIRDQLCHCKIHPIMSKSLVCCNITDLNNIFSCKIPPLKDNSTNWINIHIRNATLHEFDVSHQFWKLFKSLSVTDGNIKRITNEFTKFSMPKCLNVSNNNVTEIHLRAFTNLTQLQILDISHNNLSRIPNLSVQTNLTVDIRGNNGMLCDSVRETIERSTLKFVDPDATFCLQNQTFNWFNTTDSIPLRQLERIKQLNSECPSIPGYGNCSCHAEKMDYEDKGEAQHLILAAKVDCSGLGLLELPVKLPTSTYSLNVSNNNITSIGNHFHENPSYANILRFYADNNQISSMYELEGTTFIQRFQTFFLRKNNIDKIPEYLLSNALDDNPNGRALYLGGNKLTCDCNSAKVLKLWLLARHNIIPDYNQILCRNLQQRVVDLVEVKLCQSPHDWTDYIYYLITAEIVLLIALVMKVSYDYWVFKTAGYLPWPASEMPKLPFDWLCES